MVRPLPSPEPSLPPRRKTEPFQLTEVGGQLFGRGSTDDKGPVLGWLNVIEAMQTLGIAIPVNIKVGEGRGCFCSEARMGCPLAVCLRGHGGERLPRAGRHSGQAQGLLPGRRGLHLHFGQLLAGQGEALHNLRTQVPPPPMPPTHCPFPPPSPGASAPSASRSARPSRTSIRACTGALCTSR
jgi:hypothetical protein